MASMENPLFILNSNAKRSRLTWWEIAGGFCGCAARGRADSEKI